MLFNSTDICCAQHNPEPSRTGEEGLGDCSLNEQTVPELRNTGPVGRQRASEPHCQIHMTAAVNLRKIRRWKHKREGN